LYARFDPRGYRIDIRQAPLLRAYIAEDRENHRWLMMLLLHHLVDDNTSLKRMHEEIEAYLLGRGERLAAPQPFRNLVAQARLGVRKEEHEAFFRRMLADIDEPTAPFGLLDVQGDGSEIREADLKLDGELAQSIRAYARKKGISAASVCHLAWGQVLARVTGRREVVFGTVLFGRMQGGEGADRALGLFINTLPVRIDIGEKGAEQSMRETHAVLAELMRHEHASLALAQRCSGVAAPSPLFSALLNYRHNRGVDPTAAEERLQAREGIRLLRTEERTNYPVMLSVDDYGESFRLTVQVKAPIEAVRVCKMMRQALSALVAALETAPQTPMCRIDVLPEAERNQVLHEWNETGTKFLNDKCVQELFEEQVEKTPGAVAVEYEEERLSYEELNRRANQLAHYLRRLGVGPEKRVGICVERGVGMVVGLMGILKAGGAYVPLDPGYPRQRLLYMVEDSDPVAMLMEEEHNAEFWRMREGMAVVDLKVGKWREESEENPGISRVGVSARNLAYVIYTSGSTGTPKGVMILHSALTNFLRSMQKDLGISAEDRWLAVTTFSFDIAGLELFLSLTVGASVRLLGRDAARDGDRLLHALQSDITIMQATPSTWKMAVDAGWRGTNKLKVLCGGESLNVDLGRGLLSRSRLLWNLYGPTETTIWSVLKKVTEVTNSIPIGRPIANTQIYLLDERLDPVPVGVGGDLYIGGAGVGRGYLNRPDLTAEQFIPDPFAKSAGARMYRTGDLGRWMVDGSIEFLGRNDSQVKIRGYRIELGEIEASLREHAGVRDAAVAARDGEEGEKRLVAYVVPKSVEESSLTNATKTTFSLFFFGADSSEREDKYKLYLNAAKFADLNQFEAVWTPERHFHDVGNLYPNPATLSAALSTITNQVKLRAGSVVVPLHDPIRVAEEWSIVDNLSGGRVGIAAASGWHPRDFSLAPQNYARRKEAMLENIQSLQRLWRGEAIPRVDGNGKESVVRIFPDPIQPELPLWITAAGNQDTFILAGKLGVNVLTHLLGQTISDLANKIARYRAARAEAGHNPETGRVTVMVHALVGPNFRETLGQAKGPFMAYMQEHLGLLASWAESLEVRIDDLLDQDKDVAEFAFERYTRTASFIGTPETCLSVATQLQSIGIDEIACLIDWIDGESALNGLPHLKRLYDLARTFWNGEDLRSHLSSRLPEYMLPAAYVMLETLPRTVNGKIDHKALPIPDESAFPRRGYEPPQGEIEQGLAAIWGEVLGVGSLSRHSHFFELGGHSLLAVRLVSRIQRWFGVKLPIAILFSRPTLKQLAETVAEAGGRKDELEAPPIVRVSRGKALPLSFAQQGLWFLAQLEGVSITYHIPMGLHLRGALDVKALRGSLDAIVARHEVLRSVFVAEDGGAHVELRPKEMGVPWREDDLREVDEGKEEVERSQGIWDRVREIGREEARAPFDLLGQGPLIRARLLWVEKEEYVLFLTVHHIVSDGGSLGIMAREIGVVYGALREGRSNPLPELPIQYVDYAGWQREWLKGEWLERQRGFWRETLAGAPVLLELPTDRPRPEWQSFAGGYVPIAFEGQLTDELRRLCRKEGTTLFMTLLSAWAVVLSRLSGQQELVIGTPVANRGRFETEGLIGFFVNTLALRIDLSQEPNVAELLGRVRDVTLAAQDHQDVPFEQVVEVLQPPRRLNHTPVFQVMFTWQNNRGGLPELPEVEVQPLGTAYGVAKFDLQLDFYERGGKIAGGLTYAKALFDERTIQRQVEYLVRVLKAMVSDRKQRVWEIDLLSRGEQKLLLEEWNATEAEYREDLCIHQLFEEQVKTSPETRAVVSEAQSLTYAELNRKANRLAHYLIGLGVKPEERVGICMERSVAMVVGLMGILKAGGAYVPLDPGVPQERLRQVVGDTRPKIMLRDEAGAAALGEELADGLTVVALDEAGQAAAEAAVWEEQESTDPDARALGVTSQNVAYVIATSGSTGLSKGVMNEHRALINRLGWMQQAYGLEREDVVLQKTSFSFDVSVWEFFWTLSAGATLAVAPPEAHRDGLQLVELIRKWGVTTVHFVPSMLGVFLSTPGVEGCRTLRRVVCSGEALAGVHIEAWQEKLRGTELYNLYGPTEAAIDVTAWRCPRDFVGGRVAIGRPIANTRIYLLDEQGEPVPLGAVGEIYIGGAGVARGYVNRPELTAERFLPEPFSTVAGSRMYRTGDLGRYLGDGNIEFLGRNDHQVKIRGFRIELGEIEARLAEHPGVREAVVVVREGEAAEKRLVAYYTVKERGGQRRDKCRAEELRAHLLGKVPAYMVPAAYVELKQLPLTVNGKLDRKALPEPGEEAYARGGYEAPRGEIERTVAAIWTDLLKVERVGRLDNFFELGGHSLLAARLISRIREATGVEARVRDVFSAPTLRDLTGILSLMMNVDTNLTERDSRSGYEDQYL
jgi:amino acid adenylation domain-containing protein/natural product biosynthesis luciferase-like monooxygenase protein